MVVIRFLFALLLGFILGAGTTIWLVQSGTGDFMIKRTEVVQDLERKVRELLDAFAVLREVLIDCRKQGYVTTILGRRRSIQGVRDITTTNELEKANPTRRIHAGLPHAGTARCDAAASRL
jgi:hypothetical protein